MCGRFTLTAPDELVAEAFGLDEPPKLSARYNIAPAQAVAVVRKRAGARVRLELARWGFAGRPASSEPPDEAPPALLINARSETAASKPSFKEAFARRRCLIPADGFYEWRKGRGEAVHFRLRDRPLFAFAGLWEPGGPDWATDACLILTTDANRLVAGIHDRMPVILPPAAYEAWLDPGGADPARIRQLLRPYDPEAMEARPVGPYVNDARHEGPRCLEPPRQASLFGE
jgi:putative SOS response-associated peptidase YedK